MGKINWGRVFLCGILTGGVWYLLSLLVFVFALGGTDYAAAVEAAPRPKTFPALPFILYLAMGIWAMWLYAAIRARYGPGPKTAAVAGVALWVVAVLEVSKLVAVGFFPPNLLLTPVAAALPVIIVVAVVGAWPYKE
ncbi:MAG: hypothetical protein ACE5Q6_26695 [Dehalococcoidia bacterium]